MCLGKFFVGFLTGLCLVYEVRFGVYPDGEGSFIGLICCRIGLCVQSESFVVWLMGAFGDDSF